MADEIWRNWNTDPSLNILDPPLGAPEGTTRVKEGNNIDRTIMAACRELGDFCDTLGSIATQDHTAVDIKGGNIRGSWPMGGNAPDTVLNIEYSVITSTNAIHAGAIKSGNIDVARVPQAQDSAKFGGLTMQQWFDGIYPVGSAYLALDGFTQPPTPAGVSVTWIRSGYTGRFLKIDNSELFSYPTLSGSTGNVASLSGGEHNHGGVTGSTALTVNQLPPHTHEQRGGSAAGTGTVKTDAGSSGIADSNVTGSTGGGQGHTHTVPTENAHTHQVPVSASVAGLAIALWRRTA